MKEWYKCHGHPQFRQTRKCTIEQLGRKEQLKKLLYSVMNFAIQVLLSFRLEIKKDIKRKRIFRERLLHFWLALFN